jgi:GTP-binding protein HflX
VFVEDRLFATLDPATRSVELAPGARVLLTDTVGFIRKLPHHLVASFRATLEEALNADVLLHVIDAAHVSVEEHKEVVEDVLRDLDIDPARAILVFNKIDRLTHGEEETFRHRAQAIYHPQRMIFISAVEQNGLMELRTLLHDELREQRPEVHVVIPAHDGEALASVYREGEVVRREDVDGVIDLVVRLPAPLLGRLQRREGVNVFLD